MGQDRTPGHLVRIAFGSEETAAGGQGLEGGVEANQRTLEESDNRGRLAIAVVGLKRSSAQHHYRDLSRAGTILRRQAANDLHPSAFERRMDFAVLPSSSNRHRVELSFSVRRGAMLLHQCDNSD